MQGVRPSLIIGLLVVCGGSCIPVSDNAGGTLPPPPVDNGPPLPVPGDDPNPGEPAGGLMVFDVTIVASSLMLNGVSLAATLTVETSQAAVVAGATLADNVNDPASTVGLSGGVLLTAERSSASQASGAFVLTTLDDGSVSARFDGAGSGTQDQSRFILQADGDFFDPGAVGITYAVQAGSRFTFRVTGNRVEGLIDLNGSPIFEAVGSEVYVGTFTGTLRSSG